jgi:putative transposase
MNLREDSLDPLIDLLRSGTQDVIKLAVKAALADFLNQHADAQTSDGRAAIVRNSYHPGREILTSVGPVMIQFQRSEVVLVFRPVCSLVKMDQGFI